MISRRLSKFKGHFISWVKRILQETETEMERRHDTWASLGIVEKSSHGEGSPVRLVITNYDTHILTSIV